MPLSRQVVLLLVLARATLCLADPEPEAAPIALPEAAPIALPDALPEAQPEAQAQQQTYTGTFSGAYQITVNGGAQGSPAVPAQCPAEHPISCNSIGAPNWCCGSGNTCGWNGGSVGCCPSGQTCNSYAGGGSQWSPTSSYWAPSSTWQPSTYYTQQPQSTVVVAPAGGVVTVTQAAQAQTTTQRGGGGGGFCSTIYETGSNLPTQAQGQCGTILIAKAGAHQSAAVSTGIIAVCMIGGALFYMVPVLMLY